MDKKMMRTCMGRQVVHHSPDKHPGQGDQMTPEMMDKLTEEAAKNATGTYSNQRQIMKPFQKPEPRDENKGAVGTMMDYYNRLMGGGKK